MKCPFELPTYKDKWDVSSFCVREADGHLITAGLTEAKADYIVQAINSYEKLELLKQCSINFQCDNCHEWLTVTVEEIIGSDIKLKQALKETGK